MIRLLQTLTVVVLCLVIPCVEGAARAQTPAPQAVSPDQARRALEVLQDPQQRSRLIETLQTIATAAPAPAVPAPAADGRDRGPGSLGVVLLTQMTEWAEDASAEIAMTARTVTDFPLLWQWAAGTVRDPAARAGLIAVGWWLVLVFLGAGVAEKFVALLLRKPLRTLKSEARTVDGESGGLSVDGFSDLRLLRRIPLALGRLALELIPIAAFAAVGTMLLALETTVGSAPRLTVVAALNAYVCCRVVTSLARALVSPANRRLRLLRVGDSTAAYTEVWTRRIAVVAVFGATAVDVAQILGLNAAAGAVLVKLVALFVAVLLIIIVLQCRADVATAVRPGAGPHGYRASMRNRLADIWHYLAIVAIAVLWLAWAIHSRTGLFELIRFLLLTLAVLVMARLASIIALGALGGVFHISNETRSRHPGLLERANRYYPALRSTVVTMIWSVAGVALLEVWGLDALTWFRGGAVGERVVTVAITIGLTLAAAIAVWELFDAAVERHQARLAREAQPARLARLRTLSPILRTTALILIAVIVGLTVLSEVGVNIVPLMASAGIVGIAIGFGSQKLVQDLITGLFLLLENAMQVGDTVTVSGLSGTVENLTIRTIRLRAGDGAVHIIPFSAVTSVTNTNRGVGNAEVKVEVSYTEDTDRVARILSEIAAELEEDLSFKTKIRSGLQLWGVDKVDGATATLIGQIVCTDTGRWDVQREFNRRMKRRFQELGIALAAPRQTVLVTPAASDPDPLNLGTPGRPAVLAGRRHSA